MKKVTYADVRVEALTLGLTVNRDRFGIGVYVRGQIRVSSVSGCSYDVYGRTGLKEVFRASSPREALAFLRGYAESLEAAATAAAYIHTPDGFHSCLDYVDRVRSVASRAAAGYSSVL